MVARAVALRLRLPPFPLGACSGLACRLWSARVPTLLQKIESSAAAILNFPPTLKREDQLAKYRRFLKVESHRLKIVHRAEGGGLEVCQARAAVLDLLLQRILRQVDETIHDDARKRPPFALVASGGYGRGELNPYSDIDILFLHDGRLALKTKVHPYLEALLGTEGLLYTLYDLNFKVGHAVRSLDESVHVANNDMQSKTALLEARYIAGDQALFQALQTAVVNRCIKGHEDAYLAARLEDQATRRTKFGDSACMQEPNIKNGCGGLRDFQNLFWMAFVKCGVRTVAELVERDFLSASEGRQLEAAHDFLLRTRTELHYHCGRSVDVLTRNLQPPVARRMGYPDRSATQRLEKFMRVLYTHMRAVYLLSRTLEQRLALVPKADRLAPLRKLLSFRPGLPKEQTVDGFKLINGHILAGSKRVFTDQPRRLMRVFLHAQKRGIKLHPDLEQLIRQSLKLVNREFLADAHVHESFLEILNHRGNVAATLQAMHDVGFLGKYVPEFGKLTCLVQHEFYHQYAADAHTLMCLAMLDRVWDAEKPPFDKYAPMLQRVERPFVLYLALLLHDVGKSEHTGKHAISGAQAAGRVARRLGLDAVTTDNLKLLVEHHVLLAEVSQRRDLDDDGVIRYVAERVQTPDNLNRLTLLTFADSLGTSADLWNDFKDSLLWTLHHYTLRLLRGDTEYQEAQDRRREELLKAVRKDVPKTYSEDEISAHFHNLPRRYFGTQNPRGVLTDLTLAHQFMHRQFSPDQMALEPVVQWHNEPDRGYTTVKICTWDRAGLFCKITGALTAAGLNILSAQIFSRSDGIVIDTYFVTDANTGKLATKEEKETFEKHLNDALNDALDLDKIIAKRKAAPTLYRAVEGERIPTVVHFDNDSSDTRTAVDLETEDRVGLLYAVSHVFGELGLDISLAKIVTEKGAAIDTFYLAERNGTKVTKPERLRQIEQKLRVAIAQLDRNLRQS